MSIYRVTATKKGGVPVEVQRRKHNKTVTLLSLANVRGDHQLLLSHLKTALGTGGAIVDGAIELQGERAEALETWLIAHDAIEGMAKPKALKAAAPPPLPPPSQPQQQQTGAHQPAKTRPPIRATRPASTAYGRFVALWKSWPYWDHDWSQLPHRWEAAQAAQAAGTESDLEGGSVDGLAAATAAVRASGGSAHEMTEAGLRALGMLAEPSSFRQSRATRAQLHKVSAQHNAQPSSRAFRALPAMQRPAAAAAAAAAPPGLGPPWQWSAAAAAASSVAHGWQSRGGGGGGRGGGGRGRGVGVRAGGSMRRALGLGGAGARDGAPGKGSGSRRWGVRLTSDDDWSDDDDEEDDDEEEEVEGADREASHTTAHATRQGATQWRLSDHLPDGTGFLIRNHLPDGTGASSRPHGTAPSWAHRGRSANGRAHADEEDEALQLALALSLSEAPPAEGRPPPPAPPLPQQQRPPQRPSPPLLSPVLAVIEARLEQQRRAYEQQQQQQQQQQQLGRGAVASGVRGAASSAPSWAPPERRPLVTCEELWGDLDEDEALALAIRLSVEAEARRDERVRARQHATAHETEAETAEEEEEGEEAGEDEWDGEEAWEEEWQEEWDEKAAWDEGEASWAEEIMEEAPMVAPIPTLPPGLASPHSANNNGLSDAEALETALSLSREAAAPAPLPPPRSTATQAQAAAAAAAAAACAPTATAWALSRLKQLSMDALVDADVLIQYVLAIEDDAEVTEFVTQFLGERDESFAFALELCEWRRQEQTTVAE